MKAIGGNLIIWHLFVSLILHSDLVKIIVLDSTRSRIFPHSEHRFELTDLDRERLGPSIPVLNKRARSSLVQISDIFIP